ncbi:hypothetical protein, partial [Escherichia coli]|uniref:hypothetical protein n=1 Tax=Escherichia coli TaxID=562 RepID=UPI003593C352
ARPRRLGARLQPEPQRRGRVPGAARLGVCGHGAAQASEAALTTAALEMRWRNGWSVGATFEGEFSSVTQSYAGKGVMRYTW